jgi:SAM-dependent methyltransferase
MVGATNGILYRQLIGKVTSLPIPELRLPPGHGARLLDVGCNWGRWSIAASRLGYDVVGIDPSIGALLAAQRVSRSLGLSPRFVCADARRLPFRANTFDVAFSYSVIQHFSFEDAHKTLASIRKCTRDGGTVLIQMPNKVGIRCLYHQARRLFQPGQGFDVRYWSTGELLKAFTEAFGESQLEVDCFFGLGLQPSDRKIMSRGASALIDASEALRSLSMQTPLLTQVADSVYVRSRVDPRA